MLLLLEPESHRDRLVTLLRRWRTEERVLREALQEMQAELEQRDRQACHLQIGGSGSEAGPAESGIGLQTECDELATELVHVRMAVLGLEEELALVRDELSSGSRRGPLCAEALTA